MLRRSDYYAFQFGLLIDIAQRQSDAEFLYTVKLSYELGPARPKHATAIQKETQRV
ncbi:MAG: hypothetical protein WA220_06610 [Candidatus Nitrosopolaris sp.]